VSPTDGVRYRGQQLLAQRPSISLNLHIFGCFQHGNLLVIPFWIFYISSFDPPPNQLHFVRCNALKTSKINHALRSGKFNRYWCFESSYSEQGQQLVQSCSRKKDSWSCRHMIALTPVNPDLIHDSVTPRSPAFHHICCQSGGSIKTWLVPTRRTKGRLAASNMSCWVQWLSNEH
jgi:hypothetical protein